MFFIMKEGIIPTWEDPQNRNGGCFSYKITNKYVYDVWKKLTYLLVGNSISTNDSFNNSITGITISPKKKFLYNKNMFQITKMPLCHAALSCFFSLLKTFDEYLIIIKVNN